MNRLNTILAIIKALNMMNGIY